MHPSDLVSHPQLAKAGMPFAQTACVSPHPFGENSANGNRRAQMHMLRMQACCGSAHVVTGAVVGSVATLQKTAIGPSKSLKCVWVPDGHLQGRRQNLCGHVAGVYVQFAWRMAQISLNLLAHLQCGRGIAQIALQLSIMCNLLLALNAPATWFLECSQQRCSVFVRFSHICRKICLVKQFLNKDALWRTEKQCSPSWSFWFCNLVQKRPKPNRLFCSRP